MFLPKPKEIHRSNAVVLLCPDTPHEVARIVSQDAQVAARQMAPKVSGDGARGIEARWGDGWIALRVKHTRMLYSEHGTRGRVMTQLAGKVIPMWVDDSDGSIRATIKPYDIGRRTRTTEDGRQQALIFRRAAPIGSRKFVRRGGRIVSVPRHYPGAPGRIDHRTGRFGGVWWRHPGVRARQYLADALLISAERTRLPIDDIYPAKIE